MDEPNEDQLAREREARFFEAHGLPAPGRIIRDGVDVTDELAEKAAELARKNRGRRKRR
jgi:hypothetical protein